MYFTTVPHLTRPECPINKRSTRVQANFIEKSIFLDFSQFREIKFELSLRPISSNFLSNRLVYSILSVCACARECA